MHTGSTSCAGAPARRPSARRARVPRATTSAPATDRRREQHLGPPVVVCVGQGKPGCIEDHVGHAIALADWQEAAQPLRDAGRWPPHVFSQRGQVESAAHALDEQVIVGRVPDAARPFHDRNRRRRRWKCCHGMHEDPFVVGHPTMPTRCCPRCLPKPGRCCPLRRQATHPLADGSPDRGRYQRRNSWRRRRVATVMPTMLRTTK